MKVKLSNIIYMAIVILIIINTKIFMFGDWDTIFRMISVIISLILFFIILCSKKAISIIKKYKKINYWQILLWALFIVNIIYSYDKYNTGLAYMIGQMYYFAFLLLVYPLIYIFEINERYYNKIINVLYWAGILAIIIRFVVWILKYFAGIDTMNFLLNEAGYEWVRDNRQRIPLPCFSVIVFVKSVIGVLDKSNGIRKKIESVVILSLTILYSLLVVNARSLVLVYGFTFIIIYWFIDNNNAKIFLKILSVTIIGLGIILIGNIVNKYIQSIDNWSIVARQQEAVYYIGLLKKYWLYGIRFVTEKDSLERGKGGYFYVTDLGIVSKIIEYGFILGLTLIIPIIKMPFKCIKSKLKDNKSGIFIIGITFYILIGSFLSTDIYFVRNIFILPFILVFYEFKYSKRY